MTGVVVVAGAAGALAAFALGDATAERLLRRQVRHARARRGRPTRLILAVGRRIGTLGPPIDLDARIAAAGLAPGLRASDVMAAKAGAVVLALLLALPLAAGAPGRLGPVVLSSVLAAAFLAPDAWVRRRTRQRAAAMTAELADVLELLRVGVAAGLPAIRALAEVGRRHHGLLAGELGRAADEAALGVPREEVLGGLARRCPVPAVAALVLVLERAGRHGAPLEPALRALASDARADRARALRDRAARAAPKIQLVIALLLVPSAMLMVAAALVGTLVR